MQGFHDLPFDMEARHIAASSQHRSREVGSSSSSQHIQPFMYASPSSGFGSGISYGSGGSSFGTVSSNLHLKRFMTPLLTPAQSPSVFISGSLLSPVPHASSSSSTSSSNQHVQQTQYALPLIGKGDELKDLTLQGSGHYPHTVSVLSLADAAGLSTSGGVGLWDDLNLASPTAKFFGANCAVGGAYFDAGAAAAQAGVLGGDELAAMAALHVAAYPVAAVPLADDLGSYFWTGFNPEFGFEPGCPDTVISSAPHVSAIPHAASEKDVELLSTPPSATAAIDCQRDASLPPPPVPLRPSPRARATTAPASGARRQPAPTQSPAASTAASTSTAAANGAARSYKNNKRFRLPKQDMIMLKRMFNETPLPSAAAMEAVALKLDVRVHKIRIWFQNRRAANKRREMASASDQ